MKVHELVARCAQARESAEPMKAMRELLESWRDQLAAIEAAVDYVPGTGGNAHQVFYRAPDLTLLKVRFPNGRRTPPHDHGTWAMIMLLSGEEKNTLYRRVDGELRKAGEITLKRGAILPMLPDSVHVAECMGDVPAVGLHVYGGDIFERARLMWNPETLEEEALDWTVYERYAQAASRAPGAPLA